MATRAVFGRTSYTVRDYGRKRDLTGHLVLNNVILSCVSNSGLAIAVEQRCTGLGILHSVVGQRTPSTMHNTEGNQGVAHLDVPWIIVMCGVHEHCLGNTGFQHSTGWGTKEARHRLSTILVHEPAQLTSNRSEHCLCNEGKDSSMDYQRLKQPQLRVCAQEPVYHYTPLMRELIPRRLT